MKQRTGGGDGNQRDVLVTHLLFHEDAESKQTQDRTVGIACQDIYSIDDTGVVQKIEYENGDSHNNRHADVHFLAHLHNRLFRLAFRSQNVYGEGSGQRGECRACAE